MATRRRKNSLIAIAVLFGMIVVGCTDSATPPDTTTTVPTSTTTDAPAPTTSTTMPLSTTTTTAAPVTTTTTTTTTLPAIAFPTWRLPNHGEASAAVYVAYAPFGAADGIEQMSNGHTQLAEIGQDLWEGYGSLGCDTGAEAALGLEDGLALGVYLDTPAEAHAFADAWLAYFGEPVVGVVDRVTTLCLD